MWEKFTIGPKQTFKASVLECGKGHNARTIHSRQVLVSVVKVTIGPNHAFKASVRECGKGHNARTIHSRQVFVSVGKGHCDNSPEPCIEGKCS